ncbi:SDR family NAD(P)-dependent oxidoreductase [Devosia marina]|uniref:SDR family NAD(P)-dependent oxidoreductase n=1 Tax=Devosia marina TaxID=2683198 RepID=A0A7X3FR79_9HYPH|nr:SDR family NAD(P)-dependent oxidoreductase [Devosia marina]MVS98385.1 SDR family NAD(P)-dependent oxidoreductase [Devosia marina]
MAMIVITGAEQGLGLELTRLYAEEGHHVVAGCLNPNTPAIRALGEQHEQISIFALDVTRDGSVAAFADRFDGKVVDVLINNAGVHFRKWSVPERVSFEDWETTLRVNTLGPARVSFALRTSLALAGTSKLVTISSDWGSVSNHPGTAYDYCSSKAAVNSLMRGLAMNWSSQGVCVLMVHPGWMRTTMGGSDAPMLAGEAAFKVKSTIENATAADNGRYLNTDGENMPW